MEIVARGDSLKLVVLEESKLVLMCIPSPVAIYLPFLLLYFLLLFFYPLLLLSYFLPLLFLSFTLAFVPPNLVFLTSTQL